MKIKEVHRTANVAWSTAKQDKILLAAGTAAQQLDASFRTDAELEIFDPDTSSGSMDMKVMGKVVTSQRFTCLSWGGLGVGTSELPYGLVGGGMDNGALMLWDPSKIISGEESLRAEVTRHTGPVRCLDFNSFQQNLIATGGSNNSIYIWDVNNIDKPITPGDSPTVSHADITSVAWNKHVGHVLASTSTDGLSVVWDLRTNRPIIQFSDSGAVKGRCVDLEWNPENATQLITASEDDRSPVLQLWDLRNAYSPLKTLEQHTRGVLVMAWCPKDADMLLSCGKDNRTILWNPNSENPRGEVVAEFPPSSNWNFDVKWCPRNPALVVCSSFAPSLSVFDLASSKEAPLTMPVQGSDWPGMQDIQQPAQPAIRLQKAPKWLKRPCGATFSFGGRLVSFGTALDKTVKISTVITESSVAQRALVLQQALECNQLESYCQGKAQDSAGLDKEVWSYLQATFAADKRPQLLKLLGYTKPLPETPVPEENQPIPDESPAQGESETEKPVEDSDDPFASIKPQTFAHVLPSAPITIDNSDEVEGRISKAVLVGDFNTAVDVALENDMMTDALLLATLGDKSLLLRVQTAYLSKSESNLHMLLTSVVKSDWTGLVNNAVIANWRETFALILTYAPEDSFYQLCETLGDRLYNETSEEYRSNAVILYIVAGCVPKMVDSWTQLHGQAEQVSQLLDLVEHVSVLAKGAGVDRITDLTTSEKFIRYAELVASQGYLDIASKIFATCSGDAPGLSVLEDRVYHAKYVVTGQPEPAFPFQRVTILSQEEKQRAAAPVQQPQQNQWGGQAPNMGGYGNQSQNMTYGGYQEPQQQQQQPMYGGMQNTMQNTQPMYGGGYGGASSMPPSQPPMQQTSMQQSNFPPSYNTYSQPASSYQPPSSMGASQSSYYQPTQPTPAAPLPAPPMGTMRPMEQTAQPAPQAYTSAPPASNFASTGFPPAPPVFNQPAAMPMYNNSMAQPQAPPPMGGPQQSMNRNPTPPPLSHSRSTMMPPTMSSMQQPQTFASAPGMPPMGPQVPQMNMGMGGYSAQPQNPPQPAAPPAPVPKKPIPSEHQPLVDGLNRAIDRVASIQNGTAKKKAEDIRGRMEALYDNLRENKIDPKILSTLGDLLEALENRNYPMCMSIYNHLVQTAQGHGKWLVGIKTLFQLLQQYP